MKAVMLEPIGGGVDPDLAVFDYSKFNNPSLGPANYSFASNSTQKKIKVILPDNFNGLAPIIANASNSVEEVIFQTNGVITGPGNSIYGLVYDSSGVNHVTLDFDSSHMTSFGAWTFRGIGNNGVPCVIDGRPIDLSGVPSDTSNLCQNGMFGQASISYVRFKPNTLNISGTWRIYGSIDIGSTISAINALGETFKGTVRDVGYLTALGIVDTSQGYSLFIKDENGDTTLRDFITKVKGWTIA